MTDLTNVDAEKRVPAVPPNLPTEFHLMCTACGVRSSKVRYSLKQQTNICHPSCAAH